MQNFKWVVFALLMTTGGVPVISIVYETTNPQECVARAQDLNQRISGTGLGAGISSATFSCAVWMDSSQLGLD